MVQLSTPYTDLDATVRSVKDRQIDDSDTDVARSEIAKKNYPVSHSVQLSPFTCVILLMLLVHWGDCSAISLVIPVQLCICIDVLIVSCTVVELIN